MSLPEVAPQQGEYKHRAVAYCLVKYNCVLAFKRTKISTLNVHSCILIVSVILQQKKVLSVNCQNIRPISFVNVIGTEGRRKTNLYTVFLEMDDLFTKDVFYTIIEANIFYKEKCI